MDKAEWELDATRRFLRWRTRMVGKTVRFEQFSGSLLCATLEPPHPNHWGGLAAAFVKAGHLQPVGYTTAKGRSAHHRAVRVYRVC